MSEKMQIIRENTLVVMANKSESRGKIEKITPNVLYTGIGKVNAAMKLTHELAKDNQYNNFNLVINLGSAGSHLYPVYTPVNPVRFYQQDMDCVDMGMKPFQTPFEKNSFLKSETALQGITRTELYTADRFVNAVTDLPVVDMEGYALAKVCLMFNIPFLCVKYISDSADINAKTKWVETLKTGGTILAEMLDNIFKAKLIVERTT